MDFETLQRRLLTRVKTYVRNGELTERGLARMIGISQPHMHHILKGVRTLSVENADRILRGLNLTVLDLIAGLGSPLEVSKVTTIAGIERNQQGDLASVGAEGWKNTGKFGKPAVQPQELF
ncbi:MAG TPA: helix-turn-helix transcriptional regulator [Bryobacteraceae bacterium]|nr:helix-turn-helix transcriptional regulator [Bryobacteraceae bacterium]